MLPLNHLKPSRGLVFTHERSVFLSLLFLVLIGSACSTPDSRPGPILSPLPFQNPAGDPTPLRAPSAMEAMSRGIAAVTPPGAALQDVYYEFDSIDLAADAQAILKQNADWMKNNPKSRVEVEGHCDDLGSNEYNLALGAKRAQSAKDFLVNQGIAPERLVTISYGKEAPACFEPTDECRLKNRRARFVIFTELPTS
jgi:peptidoglycan-associated lipoprotein